MNFGMSGRAAEMCFAVEDCALMMTDKSDIYWRLLYRVVSWNVTVVDVMFFCHTLQEDCARTVLFRGADRCIKNYANQTAAELAIIADNVHISELINNYKTSDVGENLSIIIDVFFVFWELFPVRWLLILLVMALHHSPLELKDFANHLYHTVWIFMISNVWNSNSWLCTIYNLALICTLDNGH